jgi:DNA gyrase subunit A
MFTKSGQVKKSKFSDYDSRNQVLIAINLKDGDEVVAVRQTNGDSDLMMFTRNGQGIRFPEDEVRSTGRASQGVRGIRVKDGDEVVGAAIADEGDDVLLVTSAGFGKRTRLRDFPVKHRGGLGVKAIKIVSTRGTLVTARAVVDTDEVVITSSDGIVIRQAVKNINRYGRNSMGVKVMNLAEGATLSALAVAARNEVVPDE